MQAFDGPGKALGWCGAAGSPGRTEQSLLCAEDIGAPSPPGHLLTLPTPA